MSIAPASCGASVEIVLPNARPAATVELCKHARCFSGYLQNRQARTAASMHAVLSVLAAHISAYNKGGSAEVTPSACACLDLCKQYHM
jgi:hypothetical protein